MEDHDREFGLMGVPPLAEILDQIEDVDELIKDAIAHDSQSDSFGQLVVKMACWLCFLLPLQLHPCLAPRLINIFGSSRIYLNAPQRIPASISR